MRYPQHTRTALNPTLHLISNYFSDLKMYIKCYQSITSTQRIENICSPVRTNNLILLLLSNEISLQCKPSRKVKCAKIKITNFLHKNDFMNGTQNSFIS